MMMCRRGPGAMHCRRARGRTPIDPARSRRDLDDPSTRQRAQRFYERAITRRFMNERFLEENEYFMRLALVEAERAREHGDVPIGALLVRGGEVLTAAHNERELRQDPTAHAEVLALREAARAAGSWRVLDATLYVTLEPCAMCAGAIVLARVPRVVYGAS